MAFSEDIVKQAWERANGQCECMKQSHSHFYRPCNKPLVWKNRGKMGQGGWEARHASGPDGDELLNCEIVCSNCYEANS